MTFFPAYGTIRRSEFLVFLEEFVMKIFSRILVTLFFTLYLVACPQGSPSPEKEEPFFSDPAVSELVPGDDLLVPVDGDIGYDGQYVIGVSGNTHQPCALGFLTKLRLLTGSHDGMVLAQITAESSQSYWKEGKVVCRSFVLLTNQTAAEWKQNFTIQQETLQKVKENEEYIAKQVEWARPLIQDAEAAAK